MDNKQKTLHNFYLNDLTSIDTTHDFRVKSKHPEYWDFDGTVSTIDWSNKNIWFWSDTHFHHKNIIRYSDRPFVDLDDMHDNMVLMHNELVQPDDIVIWGGDVGFGAESKINDIVNRCNGYKILIVGNHDFHKRGQLYNLNFNEIHPCLVLDHDDITFWITHYPLDTVPVNTVNIHGHTHTKCLFPYNFNVSVEQIGYKPVKIEELVWRAKEYFKQING